MTDANREDASEEPRVVVRDRRKIDPETGELRQQPEPEEAQEVPVVDGAIPLDATEASDQADQADQAEQSAESGLLAAAERELAERTADLQRVQAEYTNYRRRVERDRTAAIEGAKASVLDELLPLLDDLERADQHGDLTGAFKAVADKLVGSLQRVGLEPFGAEGDVFDPSVHEAVQHSTSSDVDGPTVTLVMRRGYRVGERVLRAAMVGVTDHEPAVEPAPGAAGNGANGSTTNDESQQ